MKKTIIFSLLLSLSIKFSLAQDVILVAAASDLKFAFDSVVVAFGKMNKGKVKVTYGSSGKLTEQISNGGPFHIFFSADISYPQQLKTKGFTTSEIYQYAVGRIVLWSRKIDTRKGMNALLDPSIKKIAIANPAHAPYGKRAMESVEYYKLTKAVSPKLVFGENISQAAQFVATGAADMGIIALSLALSANMQKEKGSYFLIPAESHLTLIQAAVITRKGKGNKLATSFFEFVKSDKAISILKSFGFTKP